MGAFGGKTYSLSDAFGTQTVRMVGSNSKITESNSVRRIRYSKGDWFAIVIRFECDLRPSSKRSAATLGRYCASAYSSWAPGRFGLKHQLLRRRQKPNC
jgi:hypothetical protein